MIDGITTPNGTPFEKTETRTGMSLEYVAEKLRYTITRLNVLYYQIGEVIPTEMACPPTYPPGEGCTAAEMLKSSTVNAFKQSVTSYLALYNLLAITNDHTFMDSLITLEYKKLNEWLDSIEREGSVT